MGYSKSKRAIKRVEPYLQQMVAADGGVEFPVNDPLAFSYQLRDGIKAAKEFAYDALQKEVEPYCSYARLNTKFIIRVRGTVIVCELRDVVPVVKLRESMGTMSIPDVEDTLGVIGAAIKHKAPEMVFPSANKDTVAAVMLFKWASSNGYFLVIADNHVTLTKNDPGDLAWKP